MSNIKVTLTKSLVGQNKRRIAVANSLGLRKMSSATIQPDNNATRGKIRKIRDLVSVEEVSETTDSIKRTN